MSTEANKKFSRKVLMGITCIFVSISGQILADCPSCTLVAKRVFFLILIQCTELSASLLIFLFYRRLTWLLTYLNNYLSTWLSQDVEKLSLFKELQTIPCIFFFLFRKEQAVVWRNVRWEHGYCWALTVMAGLWLDVPWAACVLLQPLALLSAEWWFLYPAVWNLKQRKKVLLTVDTVEPMEVCSYNWLSFSPECDSPCAFSVGLLFSPIGLKRALRVYWLISEIKWALDSEGMLWKLLLLVLLITVYELFK